MGKTAISGTFSRRSNVAVSILLHEVLYAVSFICSRLSGMSYRRPFNSRNSSSTSFRIRCCLLMSTLAVATSPIRVSICKTVPSWSRVAFSLEINMSAAKITDCSAAYLSVALCRPLYPCMTEAARFSTKNRCELGNT